MEVCIISHFDCRIKEEEKEEDEDEKEYENVLYSKIKEKGEMNKHFLLQSIILHQEKSITLVKNTGISAQTTKVCCYSRSNKEKNFFSFYASKKVLSKSRICPKSGGSDEKKIFYRS